MYTNAPQNHGQKIFPAPDSAVDVAAFGVLRVRVFAIWPDVFGCLCGSNLNFNLSSIWWRDDPSGKY
jgi:hypothetical protein